MNARSCKHIRSILGDAYEDARLTLKNPDGVNQQKNKPASKVKKPTSKSVKRKKHEEEDDFDDEEEKPRKKKPTSSRSAKRKVKDEEEDEEVDEDDEDEAEMKKAPSLLLANSWKIDGGQDVTGWWISEKLDGVR